jgi:predicted acyl esterase
MRSRGLTLLGMTRVRADVAVRGRDALLVGRLWDVDAAHRRQKLVDRAVVRLRARTTVDFGLNGNAYRFAPGHRIRLELLGRDAPTYRPDNDEFSVTVRNLRVTLPTRQR